MEEEKKIDHALKILKQFAVENGTTLRSTSDLSKLEEWLLLKSFQEQEKLCKCHIKKH